MTKLPSAVEYESNPDEIDLVDLLIVLFKRKTLLLSLFVLCLVVGFSVIALQQPTYLSRTVLMIGAVPDISSQGVKVRYLEDADAMAARLKEQYRVDDETEGARSLPYIESVTASNADSNALLTLTALAYSAEAAQAYLQQAVDQILTRHQKRYAQIAESQQQLLDNKQVTLNDLQDKINTLSADVMLLKQADPTEAALLMLEIARLLERQTSLQDQQNSLQVGRQLILRPSMVLRAPTRPVEPQSPKYALLSGVIILAALFLAVLGTLTYDYIVHLKRRLQADRENHV